MNLITIFVILGIAITIIGLSLFFSGGDSLTNRMRDYATPRRTRATAKEDQSRLARLRTWLNSLVSQFQSESVYWRLTSANWQISVAEYFAIRIGLGFVGLIIGLLFGGDPIRRWFLGFLFMVILYLLPEILLQRDINKRQRLFQDQLVDVLLMISGAVKIGYSLQQSLDIVISDMSPPSNDEFRRVRREIELGLPLDHALLNLAKRMENDDLNLVVTAININVRVGGNMTNMLASVIETIRERIRLFSEIRVLTSYARYTSYLLTAMPFITALAFYLINPNYVNQIFEADNPYVFIIAPLILIAIGNVWLRQIGKFKV